MKKNRVKNALKAAAVSALAIGIFSTALIGANGLAFAAATNGTQTVPITSEAASTPLNLLEEFQAPGQAEELYDPQDLPTEGFQAPDLTVIASPSLNYHANNTVSAHAMPMEEAAQIGAQYIWDVFGTNIDGLYIEMFFAAHASHSSSWWTGNIFVENPDNPTQNYVINVDGDEKFATPVYTFTINAITGERSDISYMGQQGRITPENDNSNRCNIRMALVESGWFNMNIYEQSALVGISSESLEGYTQTARRLAESQFGISNVSEARLVRLIVNGMIDDVVDLAALQFSALSNTGREAIISFPSTDSTFNTVSILTNHNDFIPGFQFDDNGSGRG